MTNPVARFFKQKDMQSLTPWRLSLFLVICCLFGGTSQAALAIKLPLFMVSLLVIGWVLTSSSREPLRALLTPIIILGAAFFAIFWLYLIPLPPELWTKLPGRAPIETGLRLVDEELPWLPLSLTPEDTFVSIWSFLPPVAIVLLLRLDLREKELSRAFKTIIVISIFSVLLGLLQFIHGGKFLFIYAISSFENAVGLFSNANHYACFLVMIFPLCFYLVSKGRGAGFFLLNQKTATSKLAAINLIFIWIGVLLAGSMTGYFILVFAFILSVFYLRREHKLTLSVFLIGLAGMGLFALDFFYFKEFGDQLIEKFTEMKGVSRQEIYTTMLTQLDLFSLIGNGPGSFYDSYLVIENRDTMGTKFANQAHSDFLQITQEIGILGVLSMTGLASLFVIMKEAFFSPRKNYLRLAAAISVSSVFIASMPDYPLRTISVSTLFVFFVCIMTGVVRDVSRKPYY
jgi:hypothetical protein